TFIQTFNIPNHDDLVPYLASNGVFIPYPNLNLSNHNILAPHPDLNLSNHEVLVHHSYLNLSNYDTLVLCLDLNLFNCKALILYLEYEAAAYIFERSELLKIANKIAQYDGLKESDDEKPEVLTQQKTI
ncbi:18143_t:CDS:2, partial [Racocetra fulgida]